MASFAGLSRHLSLAEEDQQVSSRHFSLSRCRLGAGETQLFSLLCVGVCLFFFFLFVFWSCLFWSCILLFWFFFLLGFFLSFFLCLCVCWFYFFPPASTSTSAQKSFVIVRVSMCALIRSFFLTTDSGNSFTLKQRCLIGLRGVYTSLGGTWQGRASSVA